VRFKINKKEKKYEKIIWIRNPITLKDTPELGHLPGDVVEKLLPYLGPFIDATSEASVKTMLTKGSLEVQPL
jgi:predicted ribonuclease YlaK